MLPGMTASSPDDRPDDVLDLLRTLVSIPSVNPALDPQGAGEGELARYVHAWCAARGLETHWLEATSGRPSVVAVARGAGGGRSLMLNAHLDTVGVAGMEAPFTPREEEGRLYARGSMDMKASLAACLRVLADAAAAPLEGDLLLAAVADEEHASLGTREVLAHFGADAAVVTEPTDLDLHVAHRGFAVVDVALAGRASHTSQPEKGVNAVTHAGRVLQQVERWAEALRDGAAHPLLGPGQVQAVRVEGGRELFTTPDRARVTLERRTVPGETWEVVEGELRALLGRAAASDPDFDASLQPVVVREPFETPEGAAVAEVAEGVLAELRGRAPRRLGAPYWMDAALYGAADIPTVVLGPVGGAIHQPGEWVELASVDTLRRALAELVARYCGAPGRQARDPAPG